MTGLRWARQAGALVLILIFGAFGLNPASAIGKESPAKAGFARSTIGVFVTNVADKMRLVHEVSGDMQKFSNIQSSIIHAMHFFVPTSQDDSRDFSSVERNPRRNFAPLIIFVPISVTMASESPVLT
jgi:hypothetical protein